MENLLGQFYGMCGKWWCAAVILHNFYQEALINTGGTGYYTLTFDPQVMAKAYSYDIDLIEEVLISIENGLEVLSYKAIEYHKPEFEGYENNLVKTFECVINCEEITRKLSFHTPIAYAQEKEKIKHHNRRALELAHPGTLTFEQWMKTLKHYNYSCAYCSGRYDVLEHFIPLTFPDSGTTEYNCVPSCSRCNSLKGPYHPERMPEKAMRKFGNSLTSTQKTLEFMRQYWGARKIVV